MDFGFMFMVFGICVTVGVVLLGTFALVSKDGVLKSPDAKEPAPSTEQVAFAKNRAVEMEELAVKARYLDSVKNKRKTVVLNDSE